jgi:hypothetical protein
MFILRLLPVIFLFVLAACGGGSGSSSSGSTGSSSGGVSDTRPDAFSFMDQVNVAPSTLTESSTVTITGINSAAAIGVTGGEYSIDDGAFTALAGTIQQGQTVRVRQMSSSQFSTMTDAMLTVGGVSDVFSVTTQAEDTTPAAFSFIDQSNVPLSTLIESATVTISGINSVAAISVTGGEYSIDGGTYTSAAGTIQKGQTARVRQTSSSQFATTTNAVLTVGGVSNVFSVTTLAEDTTPNAFSFTDQSGVAQSSFIESLAVTIDGINVPAPISVTGGEYSIDGGAYTSNAGTVQQGQTVKLRVLSADDYATTTSATLVVGAVNDTFDVTTEIDVVPPTADIVFPIMAGTLVNTNSITVRGTADDNDEVMSVTVNGVAATTTDNYANWQATVFLVAGEDPIDITVDVIDTAENVNANAASTTIVYKHGLETCSPYFGFDAINGRMYRQHGGGVIEFDLDTNAQRLVPNSGSIFLNHIRYSGQGSLYAMFDDILYEIDVQTGNQLIVSAAGTDGIFFNNGEMEIDVANGLIYIFDGLRIGSIDMDNGSRAVISDNSDAGPDFGAPNTFLAFNGGRLFANIGDAVVEVDLATGDRAVISDNTSADPDFISVQGLIADVSNGVLYVAELRGELFAVDIDTGSRSVRSASDYVNNLWFEQGFDMQFDAVNSRALISMCHSGGPGLLAIDLSDGTRSRLLPPDRGAGPGLVSPSRMAMDPARNRLLALSRTSSSQLRSIVAVDPDTGDRQIISSPGVGIGQAFGELFGIAVDTLNDRILVTDNAMDAVIAVDPVSGDRSVLSDNSGSHGEGPLFVSPLGIAVYGDRALVVDVLNDALVAVDLVTGDREIISQNGGAGSGASFDAPMDLVMGGAGQAYVISQFTDTLFSVNVDTGARAIITMGVGANDFDEPSYMAVDLARNRAIISLNQPPGGTSGLMLVDLISGNREFKMFFSGVGAAGISGLLMDPATMRLYTTNYALHSIGIYDIDANSQILISR